MTDVCDLLCLDLPKAEGIRSTLPGGDEIARRSALFKALADPTRLEMALALAATDELCVCDLAWVTGRAENLVSHHMRALKGSGLAGSRREGRMVLYSLTPAGRTLLSAAKAPAA